MPARLLWSKNTLHRFKKQSKQVSPVLSKINGKRQKTCCGFSRIETVKILGTFLVPLVIGIFTIVTTIEHYNVNNQNRIKDMEIASRQRDQELKQADTLQQETVYAVYTKDIGELSLKLKTNNITSIELDQQLKVARAKTLSAIRQLNAKRKGHLIQFLYESGLIFTNRSAIDLSTADLSDASWASRIGMRFRFPYIALTNIVLTNTSFVNSYMLGANFTGSQLNNANFSGTYLFATNFKDCDLVNADLRGIQDHYSIMQNVNLSGAILSDPPPRLISNAILPNGSYVFYSNDSLQSDLFNQSNNLIFNGDANCQSGNNSTEIFGWETRFNPVAIVTDYSKLPSLTGHITRDGCVFWGGTRNSETDYLHQRVYFLDYIRLIDSGHASYQFSFDTGEIDGYNDYVYLRIEFRASTGQTLKLHKFRKYTLKCHIFIYLISILCLLQHN
jgi:uncharacterized protein YjbI with pentapeptide repeats